MESVLSTAYATPLHPYAICKVAVTLPATGETENIIDVDSELCVRAHDHVRFNLNPFE